MQRTPQQMTFREKLSEAERLTRELIHHVEHGFIPKAHEVRRVTRQGGGEAAAADEVSDMTVRSTTQRALESDRYTRNQCGQLNEVIRLIQEDIARLHGRK